MKLDPDADPQKGDDEYEALEVWGVHDFSDEEDEETRCEQVIPGESGAPSVHFYSVYHHHPGEGCMVDEDFEGEGARERALEYARQSPLPALDYTVWPAQEIKAVEFDDVLDRRDFDPADAQRKGF